MAKRDPLFLTMMRTEERMRENAKAVFGWGTPRMLSDEECDRRIAEREARKLAEADCCPECGRPYEGGTDA